MKRLLSILALSALAAAPLASGSARAADAATASVSIPERSLGATDAPVTVHEYFSLTCTHCAAFDASAFQAIKKDYINTGKVRWVFEDFPLDRVALYGAAISRSMSPMHYEKFIHTLLSTQNQWAFNQSSDPMKKVKEIALSSGATEDEITDSDKYQRAIIDAEDKTTKTLGINGTPTFVFSNGEKQSGELTENDFKLHYDAAVKALKK